MEEAVKLEEENILLDKEDVFYFSLDETNFVHTKVKKIPM